MDSDSVNSGGLNISTSTNYRLGDSVGQLATGFSSSTNYGLYAGFWVPSGVYISISTAGNVALPSLSGLTGGTATGSSAWIVTTNNTLGYQLTIVASTSPAMKGLNTSIADYAPAGGSVPDFAFTIASSTSRFGFSPEGADISPTYKDNGTICSTGGTDTTNACWDGFSTTTKTIAQSSGPNAPVGATTTVKYQVRIGSGVLQEASPGGYSASVTVTATTL